GMSAGTVTGSCGGGTISAVDDVIALSGATLAGGDACTFSVLVTAATRGTKNNTTGSISSNEGGVGLTASASIDVILPATIAKTFVPGNLSVGGTTSLSFTLTNPNANYALSAVGFTDLLPSGLVVATPNGTTGSCNAGIIDARAGSTTISLSGATLAASASCTFSVSVKATSTGTKHNVAR